MVRVKKARISKALSPAFPREHIPTFPREHTLEKPSHRDQKEAIFSSINDGGGGKGGSLAPSKPYLWSQRAPGESEAINSFFLG